MKNSYIFIYKISLFNFDGLVRTGRQIKIYIMNVCIVDIVYNLQKYYSLKCQCVAFLRKEYFYK
jgi:hypothetical protein